jgi:hypothetical protein
MKDLNSHSTFRLYAIVIALAGIAVVSCGPRSLGYGVVLWSPDDSFVANGEVIPVSQESSLRDTYTLAPEGREREMEIAKWRIRFFRREGDAEDFAERYAPYAEVLASARINGLPVRSEPNNRVEWIYRLADGERVKVLNRQDEASDLGGLRGYWYQVLTNEGFQGYVFDAQLDIFRAGEEPTATEEEADPTLQRFLATTWRPEYFQEMVENNTVDLSRFRPDYGLFPNPEDQTVSVVLPKVTASFEYTGILKVASNRYVFQGTTLQLTVRRENLVTVQYSYNGAEQSRVFTVFDQDIQEIIDNELERRAALYEQFLDAEVLESGAYGTIRFEPDRRFQWTGYTRLVPVAIPTAAGGQGSVEFSRFLADRFRGNYDGVISFQFAGTPQDVFTHFLFSFRADGVQFVYAPESTIQDRVVLEQSMSPLIVYFSFGSREQAAEQTEEQTAQQTED